MAKIWTWDGQDVTPAPRYRPGEYNEVDPRREPIQFVTVDNTNGDWNYYTEDYPLQVTATTIERNVVWQPAYNPYDPVWKDAREWWGKVMEAELGIKLSQFKFTDWKEVWK